MTRALYNTLKRRFYGRGNVANSGGLFKRKLLSLWWRALVYGYHQVHIMKYSQPNRAETGVCGHRPASIKPKRQYSRRGARAIKDMVIMSVVIKRLEWKPPGQNRHIQGAGKHIGWDVHGQKERRCMSLRLCPRDNKYFLSYVHR